MSLLNWLVAATAQINPFDQGADFNSVRAEQERRKRQQQAPRPVQRPTAQPAPRQQGAIRGNAFGQNQAQPQIQWGPQQTTQVQRTAPLQGNAFGANQIQPQIQFGALPQRNVQVQAPRPQAPRPAPPKPEPGFLDYLNPFGEHGLFGAQQQETLQKITKPVTNKLEEVQKNIDKSDKKEGFQWDSAGDYARFGAKLLPGMAQGIVEAPQKIGAGISGVRVNDGKREDLNALQRIGSFGDGFISTAGIPVGGSGTLLRAVTGQAAKNAAPQTASAIARAATAAVNTGRAAGTEALEETAQTFLSDLADNGQLNATAQDYLQSAAFGALGGGMMHGAGRSIDYAKTIPSQVDTGIHNKLLQENSDYAQLDATVKASQSLHERADLQRQMQAMRTEAKVDAWRQAP